MRKVFLGLVQFIVLFTVLVFVVFILVHLVPGGPLDREVALDPQLKHALGEKYHYNKGILHQFFLFILSFKEEGFGYGTATQSPFSALELSWRSFSNSLYFSGAVFLISVMLGILWSGLSLSFPRLVVRAFLFLSEWGNACPVLVLSLVCLCALAWAPSKVPEFFGKELLPAFALGLRPWSVVFQVVYRSQLESQKLPYFFYAQAKGLSPVRLYFRHLFLNSVLPLLDLIPVLFQNVMAGAFVVESVFNKPGIARLLVGSILNRDYPLFVACIGLYGGFFILFQSSMKRLKSYLMP